MNPVKLFLKRTEKCVILLEYLKRNCKNIYFVLLKKKKLYFKNFYYIFVVYVFQMECSLKGGHHMEAQHSEDTLGKFSIARILNVQQTVQVKRTDTQTQAIGLDILHNTPTQSKMPVKNKCKQVCRSNHMTVSEIHPGNVIGQHRRKYLQKFDFSNPQFNVPDGKMASERYSMTEAIEVQDDSTGNYILPLDTILKQRDITTSPEFEELDYIELQTEYGCTKQEGMASLDHEITDTFSNEGFIFPLPTITEDKADNQQEVTGNFDLKVFDIKPEIMEDPSHKIETEDSLDYPGNNSQTLSSVAENIQVSSTNSASNIIQQCINRQNNKIQLLALGKQDKELSTQTFSSEDNYGNTEEPDVTNEDQEKSNNFATAIQNDRINCTERNCVDPDEEVTKAKNQGHALSLFQGNATHRFANGSHDLTLHKSDSVEFGSCDFSTNQSESKCDSKLPLNYYRDDKTGRTNENRGSACENKIFPAETSELSSPKKNDEHGVSLVNMKSKDLPAAKVTSVCNYNTNEPSAVNLAHNLYPISENFDSVPVPNVSSFHLIAQSHNHLAVPTITPTVPPFLLRPTVPSIQPMLSTGIVDFSSGLWNSYTQNYINKHLLGLNGKSSQNYI